MTNTKKRARRSDCPISYGLDIFGDKWTLLIIRDLLFYNRVRFSDFTPQEKAATNILSDRLKRLEDAGIVTKKQDSDLKNQIVYGLTRKGKDLLPVLTELTLWGLRYDERSPVSSKYSERIKEDRTDLAKEVNNAVSTGKFSGYRAKRMGIRGLEV